MCAQSVTTQIADAHAAPDGESLILVAARGKTIALPSAHGHAGLPCTVKNTTTGGHTTIAAPSGQAIDGAATYKLTPALAFVRVESDGATWWVTASG